MVDFAAKVTEDLFVLRQQFNPLLQSKYSVD